MMSSPLGINRETINLAKNWVHRFLEGLVSCSALEVAYVVKLMLYEKKKTHKNMTALIHSIVFGSNLAEAEQVLHTNKTSGVCRHLEAECC